MKNTEILAQQERLRTDNKKEKYRVNGDLECT